MLGTRWVGTCMEPQARHALVSDTDSLLWSCSRMVPGPHLILFPVRQLFSSPLLFFIVSPVTQLVWQRWDSASLFSSYLVCGHPGQSTLLTAHAFQY